MTRRASAGKPQLFDLEYWLGDPRAMQQARRLGVKRLVPVDDLPAILRRLIRDCVVSAEEAAELLEDIKKENQ